MAFLAGGFVYDMQCTNPVRISKNLDRVKFPDGLLVPCGKCLSCRIAKRSEWAMRMIHELDNFNCAVFVTLTYDEEHFPPHGSLVVSDLQKFFKRLRKEVSSSGNSIRYFACGEYGDRFGRPHYHAIIFGLSQSKRDKDLISSKWPFGRCYYGSAEPDSIRYVAQYIDKKFSGDLAKTEYDEKKRAPVFRVSSLGLGKAYLEKNREQLTQMGYCTVRGVMHSLPRYYLNKLGIDPILYRQMAQQKACEDYEEATGLNLDPDIAYRVRPATEYTQYAKKQEAKRMQSDKNKKAKVDLKKRKL